ncbi:phosphotransferase family protein [Gorillibacterium timonense]|uniref:phosphotransferase family protein n=1 Tax=Gorillibacterium timonense TaxID=1689269 RepID=UPI00071CCA71|nr:phosphotransferase [Gorillibacterium timonense]
MPIRLGAKVAEGGCSEVFEWEGPDKIIKLAKPNTDDEAMRREYRNTLTAWECGLPVPRPYEWTKVEGRTGIVFEQIKGETLGDRFMGQLQHLSDEASEEGGEDIRLTARILYAIHSQAASDHPLPSQKESFKQSIRYIGHLTSEEKEAVIAALDRLPAKHVICHGDPNPGNIMVKDDGEAIILDWMNAASGNPEGDMAEYIIMIRYAVLPDDLPDEIREGFDSIREAVIDIFMDEYTKLSGITYDEVHPWIAPVAARKLSADAISEEEKGRLLQFIRQNL